MSKNMMLQGILAVWISVLLILSSVEQVHGASSFTPTLSFYQSFDLTTGMTASDPRVLIINFGAAERIEHVLAPDDQVLTFNTPVDFYPL
jgi:hypothetical protein